MRWLHISDVHYNPDMDGRSSSQLREELPAYLRQLGIRVDEVFVTGDFRFARDQGDTDEVADASVSYVRELAQSAGVDAPEHIHIVPGNHDLARYNDAGNKRKLARIRAAYAPENGQFKPADAAFLLTRFSFFKRICAKLCPAGSIWTDSLQPIHMYRCFPGYSVLYLNTAITCNDDNDRGQLVIGNNDLYLALKEIQAKNGGAPIITLAHHGLECLAKREREEIEKLLRDHSVTLFLCGDSHEVWHRRINQTAEITMGCIKAGTGVQAAFSIGELRSDGFVTVQAHLWDSRMGGWGPYTQFNHTIKNTLPQPPSATRATVFGRTAVIEHTRETLMHSAGRYAVEVQGAPGIGKSTICREVMATIDPTKATEVDLTGQFTKSDALTAMLRAFGAENPDQLEKQMTALYRTCPGHTVYLDNMEDPLRDPEYKRWFYGFVHASGWRILYSSRTILRGHNIHNIPVAPLDMPDAENMFLSLWGELPAGSRDKLKDFLQTLDRHPLCIKLAAAQKWRLPTIDALREAWKKNTQHHNMELEDDYGKHRSLATAVHMSYETIADNREALILWGILSFLPTTLSHELFITLFADDLDAYEAAINQLMKNGLVEAIALEAGDRHAYAMLSPLKDMAFAFDQTHRQTAKDLLREAYASVFSEGNDRNTSKDAFCQGSNFNKAS